MAATSVGTLAYPVEPGRMDQEAAWPFSAESASNTSTGYLWMTACSSKQPPVKRISTLLAIIESSKEKESKVRNVYFHMHSK